MKANPAIQYPKSIKAITVTVKDSKIIALLGMTNGDIEKVSSYMYRDILSCILYLHGIENTPYGVVVICLRNVLPFLPD